MAAKAALLFSTLCVATGAAAKCSADLCKMPKNAVKTGVECPDSGCTKEICCDYTWADTCDTDKLGCVSGNGDGWVPLTEDVAKAVGKAFPPACIADDDTKCNVENCCEFLENEKEKFTTTFTPWDSSASSGSEGTSLDSMYSVSSQESNAKDSSGSVESSGSNASGSSGSFLKLYIWVILGTALALCLCALCIPLMASPKKRPTKKPKPQPKPEPEPVEEEPLLPPLVPIAPEMPVTTSYVMPSYPQTTAMPMTYAMPMATTAMPYSQPGYVV